MFLKVKTQNGFQGFPVVDIKRVSPRVSGDNKSRIDLKGCEHEYYSTEEAEIIIDRINQLYENKATTQG